MTAQESLARRAILALLLMIGFYLLVIVVVAVLVLLPVVLLLKAPALAIKLGIPFWIGAYVIIRSALPRMGGYEAPGVEITAEQQPELFSLVREVAHKTSQRVPEHVFLVADSNAMVYEKGGFFGLFSTRVLCLGYPLFPVLNVSELKSIIAHEFGHYTGGDTALGPWIHTSRASALETAHVLKANRSWLSPLFAEYANFYLRTTQRISRAQEFLADRIAANVVGATAAADALEGAIYHYLTWRDFWKSELIGMLRKSYFPSISTGYRSFVTDQRTRESYQQILEEIRKEDTSDEYESHPSTYERVQRLRSIEGGGEAVNERSALTLLRQVDEVERQVVVFATENAAIFNFKAIAWEEARDLVVIPNFEEDLQRWHELVEDLTPSTLPAGETAFEAAVVRARPSREMAGEELDYHQVVFYCLTVALSLRLHQEGWQMENSIGRVATLSKESHSVFPAEVVKRLVKEPAYAEEWSAFCSETGIGDLRFSEIRCLTDRPANLTRLAN